MSEPRFLSFEQVLEIHREAIERFGGSLGIRDRSGLESAISHPQNVYFYSGGDLFDIAAAYAYHIAEAQAFLDGNKRAAIGAAFTFLEGNGVATDVDVAGSRLTRVELAALFRRHFNEPSP